MLYLFTGTDVERTRGKAFAWIEASKKKATDAVYIRIEGKELTETSIQEVTAGQGLFFSKLLVLIDEPFSSKASEEIVLEHIELLAQSQNPIALLAPSLPATLEKKLEKHFLKIFREDSKAKKEARGFNTALVNALGARDSKKLWLELQKSKRSGEPAESVHGLLHWKARDLIQKKSKIWNEEEARALSITLIGLLGESRKGNLSLYEELEEFALSI